MKKKIALMLIAVIGLTSTGVPLAKAFDITINIDDRPYYTRGPGYWEKDAYYVWVPGHWKVNKGRKIWVHGYCKRK